MLLEVENNIFWGLMHFDSLKIILYSKMNEVFSFKKEICNNCINNNTTDKKSNLIYSYINNYRKMK